MANNNRHEQVQSFQTQPPIDFNDRCSLLPPNKPPQNLSFSKIHMGPPPKDPLPLPPIIHRITSSPLPSSRYECIGDPSLRIFKLLLPRDLVGRLDGIVAHSERFAEGLAGGWKTELYSLTRQDLALRDIPGMTARIRPIFDYITQAIKALYGCRKVIVDKNQPHILKYSMDTEHTGGEHLIQG